MARRGEGAEPRMALRYYEKVQIPRPSHSSVKLTPESVAFPDGGSMFRGAFCREELSCPASVCLVVRDAWLQICPTASRWHRPCFDQCRAQPRWRAEHQRREIAARAGSLRWGSRGVSESPGPERCWR